jgi:hypothetical protein
LKEGEGEELQQHQQEEPGLLFRQTNTVSYAWLINCMTVQQLPETK